MRHTFIVRLCVVLVCILSTHSYAHHSEKNLFGGHVVLDDQVENLHLDEQDNETATLIRIDRLQSLRIALKSSRKNQEYYFLRRINGFANEVESFDDESLNLLRSISDAAYNKNMRELFVATQGLLIDYHLSKYNLVKAKEKRAFLLEQEFLPSSNDSLNIELELDIITIWNREFTNIKSIELGERLKSERLSIWQKIKLYTLLGQAYADAGNLSTSLDYYLLALDATRTELDKREKKNEILILNAIGVIFEQLGDYNQAEVYSKEALKLAYDSDLDELQMVVLSNLGVLYKNQELYEEALVSYKSALVLAMDKQDNYTMAQNKFNIGNIFAERLQYDSAMVYYKAVENEVINWDSRQEYSLALIMQASVNIVREEYDEAQNQLTIALGIQEEINNPYIKLETYHLLSVLYEKKQNFKEALNFNNLEKSLKDSLNSEQQAIEIQKKITVYEQTQTELQKTLAKEKERVIYTRNLGISVVLIVVVLFSVIVFALERKQKRVEKELFSTNLKLTQLSGDELKRSVSEIYFGKPSQSIIKENKQLWELFNYIMEKMITEKWYRNPEFSLGELTKKVKSNTKYVSSAIKLFSGLNFNYFVNTFRVQEATEWLLRDNFVMTMEELMQQCGFQNRGTFYRAFNAKVGMTPKEFRKRVVSEKDIM